MVVQMTAMTFEPRQPLQSPWGAELRWVVEQGHGVVHWCPLLAPYLGVVGG